MSEEGRPVQHVGVVGEKGDEVREALERADVEVRSGLPHAVLDADPDVVVGVGEAAMLDLARARPTVPVVPVDAGRGLRSVPAAVLEEAIDHLAAGRWQTESHPLVGVAGHDGDEALALYDAMLVTAEPAHISEFSVFANGDRVGRFRADGVVVATPAGTPDYARSAGAPVIPPGTDVAAVTPVAPFSTDLDDWVVPLGEVEISVEREDAVVHTLVDDRRAGSASVDHPVCLSTEGHVDVVRLAAGRSPFR